MPIRRSMCQKREALSFNSASLDHAYERYPCQQFHKQSSLLGMPVPFGNRLHKAHTCPFKYQTMAEKLAIWSCEAPVFQIFHEFFSFLCDNTSSRFLRTGVL